MKLSKFLSSRTGKRFYNLCYCWGACLVILGAVFKNANINPHTGVSDTLMTEKYIQQLKRLENNVCKLNETYEAQIKGMTEHAKSLNEMNSEELKKETEKMAAYIELLNKQYSQLNAMNVKTGK